MFDEQKQCLLTNLESSHDKFYESAKFSGPSLHFHLKSLEASRSQSIDQFSEYAYAMLASWGMHRMGKRGSKMCEFKEFKNSLQLIWPMALDLQERLPNNLVSTDWTKLKEIFCTIRCMASGTSLVGNSKVMAHLLPNLIPPVDRRYTLNFLFNSNQINNNIENEWKKLREILSGFFYPVFQSQAMQIKSKEWLTPNNDFKWDTSPLKIIDNLLIGYSVGNHNHNP